MGIAFRASRSNATGGGIFKLFRLLGRVGSGGWLGGDAAAERPGISHSRRQELGSKHGQCTVGAAEMYATCNGPHGHAPGTEVELSPFGMVSQQLVG